MRALPIIASAASHSQSTVPSSSQRSMSTAQIFSKRPRRTQRWKVRCTELSSGKRSGSWFHWQPLRSRKIRASSAARGLIRGRPVALGGSSAVMTGSISAHNLSETVQIVPSSSQLRRNLRERPMLPLLLGSHSPSLASLLASFTCAWRRSALRGARQFPVPSQHWSGATALRDEELVQIFTRLYGVAAPAKYTR